MIEFDTLIFDLDAAERGSRELDARIGVALEGHKFHAIDRVGRVVFDVEGAGSPVWRSLGDFPAYTSALEDALTLVPEGYGWEVWKDSIDGRYGASCIKPACPESDTTATERQTPALALSIAALTAIKEQNDD